MVIRSLDKSIIIRKMFVEENITLTELYDILGDCIYIEDLHMSEGDRQYIIGTIRKPYSYDAKRIIGNLDVTGKDEYKFFKFLIKQELGYFLISCHYEGNYGGFNLLKEYLFSKIKNISITVVYKEYRDITISDLKKIEWSSMNYTKKNKTFGIFTQKKQEYIEVNVNKNDNKELATIENIKQYVDLPDIDVEDDGTALYITLKNNKKINLLNPQNTHFRLDNLKYKDDLPEENDFVNKVYKIWESI